MIKSTLSWGKHPGRTGERIMPASYWPTKDGGSLRPPIAGIAHGISAGHYLAAEAGFAVLEDGGNAIDAGIAAVIALAVVQSNFVNVAGVAPIILYSAERDELMTIDGLGTWPAKATLALFEGDHGGAIPVGPSCALSFPPPQMPGSPHSSATVR